jgi:hypothetical protein
MLLIFTRLWEIQTYLTQDFKLKCLTSHKRYAVDVEVRRAMKIETEVFWDMPPCSVTEIYKRFGETYCFHLQGTCWICGQPSGTGVGLLRVLRFPLPILIPPTAPHSSYINQGRYNKPVSGRRTKWTVSPPQETKKKRNFKTEDGSSIFFWKADDLLVAYTVTNPWIPQSQSGKVKVKLSLCLTN